MRRELQEKFGLVGVAIGVCLMVAHAIHLPLVLLGTLGFGGSSMMNSWTLQTVGAVLTIISIILLVKNESMKTKIIAGMIIAVGVIALAGFGWSQMSASMHNGDSNSMSDFPCHQMGGSWMGTCLFDENGEIVLDENGDPVNTTVNVSEKNTGETFSNDVTGLEEAKPTEIVELEDGQTYELSAEYVKQTIDGVEVRRLAYNGMIPGPTIKAVKGTNATVVFTNNLDIETTVHAHGLRGESKYDGVPKSMGGEQDPVKPGESFTYIWEFPDTGLFWYHPHMRTDYTTDAGLQGNFWVTESGYWNDVDREELLVLDDVTPQEPFFIEKAVKTLMGRFGTTMLVNNQEDYSLEVNQGETVRFFMTNTANVRPFDVAIEDVSLKLVGSDIGRVEQEQVVDSIIISPSERYIFEVTFDTVGTYNLVSRDRTLGSIMVSSSLSEVIESALRNNSNDFTVIKNRLPELLVKEADKSLTIDIDMPSMQMNGMMDDGMVDDEHGSEAPHGDEGIEWEDEMAVMNQMTDSENLTWILRDEDTSKENQDIFWSLEKDSLTKIKIYNDPKSMHPMQHPIHFHGQKMVVISRNGEPVDSLQWEDTVFLRTGEKIEVILQATNEGQWLAHCHINEHAEAGMKFNFEVI